MSKAVSSQVGAWRLEHLLRAHPRTDHLLVRSRGDHLTLFAREGDQEVALARLTSLSGGHYGLSLMWHNGRWERMPHEGTMEVVLEELLTNFGDLLEPLQSATG